jgi:hypothetical protein
MDGVPCQFCSLVSQPLNIVNLPHVQGGTLKAMRELLHTGERLGVGVAATAALRARIRRREWEDSARKALSTKSSVAALAGGLSAAAAPLESACMTSQSILMLLLLLLSPAGTAHPQLSKFGSFVTPFINHACLHGPAACLLLRCNID